MRKACLAGVKTRIDGSQNPKGGSQNPMVYWESKPEITDKKGRVHAPPFFFV